MTVIWVLLIFFNSETSILAVLMGSLSASLGIIQGYGEDIFWSEWSLIHVTLPLSILSISGRLSRVFTRSTLAYGTYSMGF